MFIEGVLVVGGELTVGEVGKAAGGGGALVSGNRGDYGCTTDSSRQPARGGGIYRAFRAGGIDHSGQDTVSFGSILSARQVGGETTRWPSRA
jgi:hypothetical protein